MQTLSEAKVQPEDGEEEDPEFDGVENDTLSPRFREASRIPDYTLRDREARKYSECRQEWRHGTQECVRHFRQATSEGPLFDAVDVNRPLARVSPDLAQAPSRRVFADDFG